MATQSTKRCPLKKLILLSACLCGAAGLSFFLLSSLRPLTPASNPSTSTSPKVPSTSPQPALINFQPTVDRWLSTVSGNASIIIYDLDHQQPVASHLPDTKHSTASLYKLFVVYEGYRQIAQGKISPQQPLVAGHNIAQCLDLAIRESNSTCAEALWSLLGRAHIDQTAIQEFGATHTSVSGLSSTPHDILTIMQRYYEHPELSAPTWATIQDSFLNQPVTTYDWRRGLPAGFQRAKVYNKVGWEHSGIGNIWNLYHDAAIVEFPEFKRHYIVVVMTEKVPYQSLAELGRQIEKEVLTH